MKEMSEMNNFSTMEDKAISAQLDGESVVKEIKNDFSFDFGKKVFPFHYKKWLKNKGTFPDAIWYKEKRGAK